MRKWLVALLTGLLLLALVACGAEDTTPSDIGASSLPISTPGTSGESDAPAATTTVGETTAATTQNKSPSAPSINKPTTTTTTTAVIQAEKPATGNTAVLWDGQHSSYDAKAEEKRLSIVNAKDTVKPSATGKTYYVSYKGNDANDGLTPATAWRSTARVGIHPTVFLQNGTVLFERGGVYRGTMKMCNGLSIGAYGSGPKPQLYGSPRNYADESLWLKTNTANVWRLGVGDVGGDIGNIVFDYGKELSAPGKKLSGSKLAKDYDFYHDIDKGYVYVYLAKGNPGKLHESIELATNVKVITGLLNQNVTIDNLCIKYAKFGIGADRVTNLTITNCEIGYIGGNATFSADGVANGRIGNGIELFNAIENIRVENNWIYQCYDAGYTNQGHKGDQKNILVKGNLIEYCNYNIEVFTSDDDTVIDAVYENNILRFSGYGFGSYSRWGSDCSMVGHVCSWRGTQKSRNFVFRNNIFDVSAYQLISSDYTDGVNGPTYVGNTWIQQKSTKNYAIHTRKNASDSGMSYITATDQATLKEAVAWVDKSATVIFE